MRGKNKVMLATLLTTFVATSGMFYYQNVYLKQQDESNKVMVLVAKKDIAEGSTFTPENVGAIKIDKESVLPTYVTKFEDLKGKSASDDLLANEIITKPRINGVSDGTKQFTVGVEAKNIPSQIKKGDFVRVYMQTIIGSKVYEVFEKKEVVAVNYKKSSSGKETSVVQSVDLLMSDKEAVTYFNAQKAGDILIVRYHDLTENDTVDVPRYDMNSAELIKLKADSKVGSEKQSVSEGDKSDGTVRYVVKSGDTFESIAQAFNVTPEEIKAMNPGVTTLSPGDKIQVKKK